MKKFIAVVLVAVAYGSVMKEKLPEKDRRQDCPTLDCVNFCPGRAFTTVTGDDGCPECLCACPDCSEEGCEFGFAFDENNCPICECPVCAVHEGCSQELGCKIGNEIDEDNCPICECEIS